MTLETGVSIRAETSLISTRLLPIPRSKHESLSQGGNALACSPADFRKLIADETEKWVEPAADINLKKSLRSVAARRFITPFGSARSSGARGCRSGPG